MRIDGIQNISQVYNGKSNVRPTAKTSKNDQDRLEISQAGKDYQIAKKEVEKTEDVREGVVAGIKNRIEQGTYQVSPDEFAERVIEKYNQLML